MPKLVMLQPIGGNLYVMSEVSGHPDQGLPPVPGYPAHPMPTPPGHHPAHPLPPSWPGYPTTGPVFPGKPVDPGFGVPPGMVWWPVRPDNSLPAVPGAPDNSLPAIPGVPDNTLPTTPPPAVPDGKYLVMVRLPDGTWKWALVDAAPVPTPQ